MHQPRTWNVKTIGIYAVAALLAANLMATLLRSDGPAILPAALAQRQAPIAGGGGIYIMPAQLSGNVWGCYLIDTDRGTLGCYQFYPGAKQLQFVAARSYLNDTKLMNYNTTPSPSEVADLVKKQEQAVRGLVPAPDNKPDNKPDDNK